MRLGQLARKYDVSLQDIISYLNEMDPPHNSLHHNSKLDEQIELMVVEHFDIKLGAPEDPQNVMAEDDTEESEQITKNPLEEINEEMEAELQMELDPSLPPIKIQESHSKTEDLPKKKHEVIESDKLIELLDSEETEVDLSKITLIKAPKKELDGLKVVGKIDLPEPKSKSDKLSEQPEEKPKPDRYVKHDRQRLSEEEKENRRLKAKEKKEQYEARQNKRRLEGEKKKRKAQNKARYEEKMRKVKAGQAKQKIQKDEVVPEVNDQPRAPKPRTILGKFWQWLNAEDAD